MEFKLPPLTETTINIKKQSLRAVATQSLKKHKYYNDNDVTNFQNMQTCFFLTLPVASYFADEMIPLMNGSGKKDLRMILNTLNRASKLYQHENKFIEYNNESNESVDNWLDLEDDISIFVRKLATAITERRIDELKLCLTNFVKLNDKPDSKKHRAVQLNEYVDHLEIELKNAKKEINEILTTLND